VLGLTGSDFEKKLHMLFLGKNEIPDKGSAKLDKVGGIATLHHFLNFIQSC